MRDLHRVGEARTEVIGRARGEDLRLAGEAAEGAGLDDALAVALEGRAGGVVWSREGAGEERIREVEIGYGARIEGLRHPLQFS